MKVILFKDLRSEKGIIYQMKHIDRLMAKGAFPRSFFLSERKQAWDEADIDAWLAERKAGPKPAGHQAQVDRAKQANARWRTRKNQNPDSEGLGRTRNRG